MPGRRGGAPSSPMLGQGASVIAPETKEYDHEQHTDQQCRDDRPADVDADVQGHDHDAIAHFDGPARHQRRRQCRLPDDRHQDEVRQRREFVDHGRAQSGQLDDRCCHRGDEFIEGFDFADQGEARHRRSAGRRPHRRAGRYRAVAEAVEERLGLRRRLRAELGLRRFRRHRLQSGQEHVGLDVPRHKRDADTRHDRH